MVIPDWGASPRPQTRVLDYAENEIGLARAGDRIAGTVVDLLVVLLPVYLILSAPIKRALTVHVLLGQDDATNFDMLVLLIVGFGLNFLYQTFFIYKRKATPGQAWFGLEVRPTFDGQLNLSQSAYRATLWTLGVFSFGLTWLSVWTDPRRRTVHDRLANTVVVTRSPFPARAPVPREVLRARCAMGAALLVCVGSALNRPVRSSRASIAAESARCDDQIKGEKLDTQGRIASALTLFSAGMLDRECLAGAVEADQKNFGDPTALSYLARAFVQADNPDLSDKYLDAACTADAKSSACAMAHLVGEWSEDRAVDGRIDQILNAAPRGSGFLEVWAIRHAMQSHRFTLALTRLSEMENHRELADFIADQRIQALNQGRRPAAAEDEHESGEDEGTDE